MSEVCMLKTVGAYNGNSCATGIPISFFHVAFQTIKTQHTKNRTIKSKALKWMM
jgi:hypothetical protein